jgi:phosphatidylglycerophosphate synthase
MSEAKPAGVSLITTANVLTYSRLILLPFVIVGVATARGWLAVAAMVVLWITDLLDGRVARRLGQASAFGKALDSTVDFVLIYCLFITFYAAGRLVTYQFAFLYLGMITTLTLQLALTAAGRGDEVVSGPLAKLTGALQYAFLLFLVALEVMPKTRTLSLATTIFFALLALAIVLSSIQCVAKVRGLACAARSG